MVNRLDVVSNHSGKLENLDGPFYILVYLGARKIFAPILGYVCFSSYSVLVLILNFYVEDHLLPVRTFTCTH